MERGKTKLINASNGPLEWSSSFQPSPSIYFISGIRQVTHHSNQMGEKEQIHLSGLHFLGLYMSETNNESKVRSAFCSLPPDSDHLERCCRELEMQAWRRGHRMCRNCFLKKKNYVSWAAKSAITMRWDGGSESP